MNETAFLDAEEKELIESLEKDGWKSADDLDGWKARLSGAAANTLAKDCSMNIRISQNDLNGIKLRAVEEGMPYQTLAASIIHKYVTGKLTENLRG